MNNTANPPTNFGTPAWGIVEVRPGVKVLVGIAVPERTAPDAGTLGHQQAWVAIDSLLRELNGDHYARDYEKPIGGALRTIREWHTRAQEWKDVFDLLESLDGGQAIHQELDSAKDAAMRVIRGMRDDAAAFKNFHRSLCERFNYLHDEKDWRRDQVSLIEHIAKRIEVAESALTAIYGKWNGEKPPLRMPGGPASPTERAIMALDDVIVGGEAHPLLRDKLVEMGWAPPLERCRTCGASEPGTGSCGTHDGDTQALCKRPPKVVRSDTPPNQYVIEGAPPIDEKIERMLREMGLLRWTDAMGSGHTMAIEMAQEVLKRLYDEWPGGIDDVIETTRGLRRADARVGEFERLLEDIGIVREGGKLFLRLIDQTEGELQVELRSEPDSNVGRWIAAWMMRKQALLHGEARPGQAEATVAKMTAPADLAGAAASAGDFTQQQLDEANNAWTEWCGERLRSGNGLKIPGAWPARPVAPGTRIRVRFRDGDELETDAPEQMRWPWSRPYCPTAADIVAYQIVTPASGGQR